MNHKIYTIGFGQKNAKCFFGLLWANGIRKVIDVRLNNVSQLAGFTKKQDLEFFLAEICQCGYEHQAQWAPTKELLDSYKKKQISWNDYEKIFLQIMKKRNVLESVDFKNNVIYFENDISIDYLSRNYKKNLKEEL